MNKPPLSLFSATLVAIPLAVSACNKSPAPAKNPSEKTPSSASISAPNELVAKPKPQAKKGPQNNEEFVANMISCEATVNAHIGYMQSINKRTGSEIIDLDSAPCNIVLDIHGNVSRIMESCGQVTEPSGLFFEFNPIAKANRAHVIEQAQDAKKTAAEIKAKIEKHEAHCFPDAPKFTNVKADSSVY